MAQSMAHMFVLRGADGQFPALRAGGWASTHIQQRHQQAQHGKAYAPWHQRQQRCSAQQYQHNHRPKAHSSAKLHQSRRQPEHCTLHIPSRSVTQKHSQHQPQPPQAHAQQPKCEHTQGNAGGKGGQHHRHQQQGLEWLGDHVRIVPRAGRTTCWAQKNRRHAGFACVGASRAGVLCRWLSGLMARR